MNLLGKIFVGLILILSLVFMTLAMAVYATHKNWQEIVQGPNGLRNRLQEAEARNDQLQDQYNRLESKLTGELESARQQLSKSETERVALVERNAGIQAELDELKQQRRDATAAVAATQQNNERLAAEVTDLRQRIRDNQQARDRAFAQTLDATEALHQTAGQLENSLERTRQLTDQVASMTSVMQAEGLDPSTDPDGVVPTVDGFISRIRQTQDGLLAEVTIGSDDGLKPEHTLEVFRGTKYLGRLDVLKTSPDKSVGRVNRRYQQGQILEGDRVATRLRIQ